MIPILSKKTIFLLDMGTILQISPRLKKCESLTLNNILPNHDKNVKYFLSFRLFYVFNVYFMLNRKKIKKIVRKIFI